MKHITNSLDNIEKMLVQRLETMQEEDHAHITETHENVIASIAVHKEELADMRKLLDALRPDAPPTAAG